MASVKENLETPFDINGRGVAGLNKTKNRRRRGFTLIEMIVVIAIIAVLIALVAPLMTKYIATAKETRYRAAAKQLYTAAQAYIAEELLNGLENCVDGDPN